MCFTFIFAKCLNNIGSSMAVFVFKSYSVVYLCHIDYMMLCSQCYGGVNAAKPMCLCQCVTACRKIKAPPWMHVWYCVNVYNPICLALPCFTSYSCYCNVKHC